MLVTHLSYTGKGSPRLGRERHVEPDDINHPAASDAMYTIDDQTHNPATARQQDTIQEIRIAERDGSVFHSR